MPSRMSTPSPSSCCMSIALRSWREEYQAVSNTQIAPLLSSIFLPPSMARPESQLINYPISSQSPSVGIPLPPSAQLSLPPRPILIQGKRRWTTFTGAGRRGYNAINTRVNAMNATQVKASNEPTWKHVHAKRSVESLYGKSLDCHILPSMLRTNDILSLVPRPR